MRGEDQAIDLQAERGGEMHRIEPSQQMTFGEVTGVPRDRTGNVDHVRGLEQTIESPGRDLRRVARQPPDMDGCGERRAHLRIRESPEHRP